MEDIKEDLELLEEIDEMIALMDEEKDDKNDEDKQWRNNSI